MKFIIVSLLFRDCLTITWPTDCGIKSLNASMTIKAGQTYDSEAKNRKSIRFDRGRKGLGDCIINVTKATLLKLYLLDYYK